VARERGIDVDRLVFAPVLPLEVHLARLACADLFLDAWPCNAHTTAGEALWVGVPVITVQGRTFAQRVAASLLGTLGLDELVAGDVAAYSALVVALAGDAPRRATLRAELVARRTTMPLFDGAAFARDIESLYRRMWQRAVTGQAPAHLPAERTACVD
jgi:predicted O-linked N-acetylglucosamine transferase (SPINDLY family)